MTLTRGTLLTKEVYFVSFGVQMVIKTNVDFLTIFMYYIKEKKAFIVPMEWRENHSNVCDFCNIVVSECNSKNKEVV